MKKSGIQHEMEEAMDEGLSRIVSELEELSQQSERPDPLVLLRLAERVEGLRMVFSNCVKRPCSPNVFAEVE